MDNMGLEFEYEITGEYIAPTHTEPPEFAEIDILDCSISCPSTFVEWFQEEYEGFYIELYKNFMLIRNNLKIAQPENFCFHYNYVTFFYTVSSDVYTGGHKDEKAFENYFYDTISLSNVIPLKIENTVAFLDLIDLQGIEEEILCETDKDY